MNDVFLLYPENRPVLNGDRSKLVGEAGCGDQLFSYLVILPVAVIAIGLTLFLLLNVLINVSPNTAQAKVVSASTRLDDEGNTSYVLVYSYVAGKNQFQSKATVDQTTWERAQAQQSLEVGYASLFPFWARPKGESLMGWMIATAATYALWVCLIPLRGWFLRQAEKERSLARDGVILEGTVTSASISKDDEGEWTTVNYRASTPDGRVFHGQRTAGGRRVLPVAGTPVAILYLRDDSFEML